MENIKFLVSSSQVNLATALEGKTSATVEAEYGDLVVEGSVLTLAHHGPRSGNSCPCLVENRPQGEQSIEVVGLSHMDLDTIGGCAALLGLKPDAPGFWELAAFIDVSGPHKLVAVGAKDEDVRRLAAYWAWAQKNRFFAPRDGSVVDATDVVLKGIEIVERIIADDSDLLAEGDAFRATEETLNKGSFVEMVEGLVVRVNSQFTNHLYVSPGGEVGWGVVALNLGTGGVTMSLADPISGVSAVQIVQTVWGSLAGGHAGIAGSPRGQKMGLNDLIAARDAAVAAHKAAYVVS